MIHVVQYAIIFSIIYIKQFVKIHTYYFQMNFQNHIFYTKMVPFMNIYDVDANCIKVA